jgi:hypothetical protein
VEYLARDVDLAELACLLFFIVDLAVRVRGFGKEYSSWHGWPLLRAVVVCACMLNLLLPILGVCSRSDLDIIRLARPLIPLSRSFKGRDAAMGCVRALVKVGVILALFAFAVLFYSLIGVILYNDPTLWSDHFYLYSTAAYSLFLVVLGVDIVPLMQPYYEVNKWTAVFFLSFVILSAIFLVKLLLSVSSSAYKEHIKHRLLAMLTRRKVGSLPACPSQHICCCHHHFLLSAGSECCLEPAGRDQLSST